MQSEMPVYARLRTVCRLPAGKHLGILTSFQTEVNKKTGQKWNFFGHPDSLVI
jgi:hypothetical protein